MMGNMQITPLMYFQLNNVPLWKGAYTIIKVTHEITAGNINTNFEGVRINRYAIPFADSSVVTLMEGGERSGGHHRPRGCGAYRAHRRKIAAGGIPKLTAAK